MSAHITVDQTATGWKIAVTDADQVVIEVDGAALLVALHPDDDDTPKPLDVTLQS
jgi:hypothetical protein